LKDPDVGQRFQDAYDVKAMRPVPEWEAIYRRVKKEITELGIPLDDF
jgi:hypothetical protein